MTGLEVEMVILNKKGFPVNKGAELIKACKARDKKFPIVKEIMQCMVELNSYPSVKVQNTTASMLDYILNLMDEAEKRDLHLYPLGLYPGNVKTKIFPTPHYKFMQKMLGKEEVAKGTYATGMHFHYTLPRGVFDRKKKFLKPLVKSKVAKTMIDSYNFGIAADPALAALMASSPIHNGRFVAKDTRLLLWRPGKDLGFQGAFHKQPKLAGLPIYKSTLHDLTYMLEKRQQKLHEVFGKHGYDQSLVNTPGKSLRFSWHALRMNRIGTMELRMIDMNHPKYIVAASVMLKYVFRKIQQDFLHVLASDVGKEEPFKVEGNIVHIPPQTYVRKHLQKLAIYEGLENKEVRNYARRFFHFAKWCTPPKFYESLRPIQRMLERNKSVSDVLLSKFKKRGFGREDLIPDAVCAEVARTSCRQMRREIETTKKQIEELE
jgi:hypothetical protein